MKISSRQTRKIEKYLEEKNIFYLLEYIIQHNGELYSDSCSYLIGSLQSHTWIWNQKDLDISSFLNDIKKMNGSIITCRKEGFSILQKYFDISQKKCICFYLCRNLSKPKELKGTFSLANDSDKELLTQYFMDNYEENLNKDGNYNSFEKTLLEVEYWIHDKTLYVLKDSNHTIVAMAGYSVLDGMAKITYVFTPKKYRNRGYCQSLIYYLTKYLMDSGYEVILYTEKDNISSNCAYQRVGFECLEELVEFKIGYKR